MERTIDGIDYIAQSEVLRIIDADAEEAGRFADDSKLDPEYRYGWECRYLALAELREQLFVSKER